MDIHHDYHGLPEAEAKVEDQQHVAQKPRVSGAIRFEKQQSYSDKKQSAGSKVNAEDDSEQRRSAFGQAEIMINRSPIIQMFNIEGDESTITSNPEIKHEPVTFDANGPAPHKDNEESLPPA